MNWSPQKLLCIHTTIQSCSDLYTSIVEEGHQMLVSKSDLFMHKTPKCAISSTPTKKKNDIPGIIYVKENCVMNGEKWYYKITCIFLLCQRRKVNCVFAKRLNRSIGLLVEKLSLPIRHSLNMFPMYNRLP